MKGEIIERLCEIELENNITILYACESGSRAWGFDNAESDYDVRFIFMHNDLKDYLKLSNASEVIDFIDGDLDIVGWDIRKALILHFKSNPNLREWTVSPVVYIGWKMDLFNGLPDFDPSTLKHHYLSIAFNNWKKLSNPDLEITKRTIKMYMYNCRCLLTWMAIDEGTNPSINIFDLLDEVRGLDESIHDDIVSLIDYYKANCTGSPDGDLVKRINVWMAESLKIMRGDSPEKGSGHDMSMYDEKFFKIITNLINF